MPDPHRSQGRAELPLPVRLGEKVQAVLRRGEGELSAGLWLLFGISPTPKYNN
jgi:hypothetical protein